MKYALVRFSGIYLFDENIRLVDKKKVEFDAEDILTIKEGKLPNNIKKILPQGVLFLGQRFEDFRTEDNVGKIRKALGQIRDEDFITVQPQFVRAAIRDISRSVTRDLIIIQAISMLDDLNKIINLMMERFREWYELYLPELSQMIDDHEKFVKTVSGKTREELMKEYGIEDTMGGDLTEMDIEMLNNISKRILELYRLREDLRKYIEKLMEEVAPNVKAIAGPTVGARLIALAGGLKELAMLPASTIQVLGAEKALFRHLRKGTPPPKHGVLFNHPMVQKLPKKRRGAMARTLAAKISIAAKVDAFTPGKFIADRLQKELEERFRQLKEGIKGKTK
ncbi:MAG TPA: C/D box methylation guide ribonucleoprotein complex aNOP56 subunit [Candidatus Nanopusillus sp.]|nr:C/D box methylation guide ribonucleoprotein complex aNOP56 subunit [Candidatus Nanopusillus sp.]HIP90549.1 C/D box methylation guide ribonucleoprotein complex aNOP56 subunit [Candidatus Nanopusillus sp.]